MTNILLQDAYLSEVNARVAYQLIVIAFRKQPEDFIQPEAGIAKLSAYYGRENFGTVSFWLLAFQVRVASGEKVKEALNEMIHRSRLGHTFRSVAFTAYKANRRPR